MTRCGATRRCAWLPPAEFARRCGRKPAAVGPTQPEISNSERPSNGCSLTGGGVITQIDIMVDDPSTNLLAGIKQVSLQSHAIAEPGTLALLGVALAGIGLLRRRSRKHSSMA